MDRLQFKTAITTISFSSLPGLLAGAVLLLCSCAPANTSGTKDAEGTFLVSSDKIYETSAVFDIRDTLVYPAKDGKIFDPGIYKTDKKLAIGDETTLGRCNRCHDCGFDNAWDMAHYPGEEWDPWYTGNEWEPIVMRMRNMQSSLLNETVADRIFFFLRDETLGIYDEAADDMGASVREVEGSAEPGGVARPRPMP